MTVSVKIQAKLNGLKNSLHIGRPDFDWWINNTYKPDLMIYSKLVKLINQWTEQRPNLTFDPDDNADMRLILDAVSRLKYSEHCIRDIFRATTKAGMEQSQLHFINSIMSNRPTFFQNAGPWIVDLLLPLNQSFVRLVQ